MKQKIPITRPFFGDEEREALTRPLDTGWVVQGPYVKDFERRFGLFTGARYNLATTSCTTALHLAVASLGLKRGDEVIVPAFTWVATANVVEYCGATPVFCDVRLSDFNLDVAQLEALVTRRTVGVIPVHLFGLCADMDAVLAFARRHSLWVVEDAACGFGAGIAGRHAGTFGDAGCFSFHPRKAITTGEGGMLTTGRGELAALVQSLRDHGASRSDRSRHEAAGAFLLADYPRVGFNYRMTDLQGAIGCAQMNRAEWVLGERRRLAAQYDAMLASIEWLRVPVAPPRFEHGYQAYVCLFQPQRPSLTTIDSIHRLRNTLMATLEEEGIATRQGTHAAALVGYYAQRYQLTPDHFPNAWIADRASLTLPLYPGMSGGDQETVVQALQRAFASLHRAAP
jgi:dTDP-4-amino-4,6-dideoxygalactose transaminase